MRALRLAAIALVVNFTIGCMPFFGHLNPSVRRDESLQHVYVGAGGEIWIDRKSDVQIRDCTVTIHLTQPVDAQGQLSLPLTTLP